MYKQYRMSIRKIVIFIFFFTSVVAEAHRLESGSLFPLKNANRVNFELEFVSIHGMSEEAFSKYETDWYKDKPEIVGIFTGNANNKLDGIITLGAYPNSDFTIKAVVNEISIKGNYNCDIIVIDAKKNIIAKISNIKANGGTWGSKLNLIKDGAESTGKLFGRVLKSEIKKSKK